MLTLIWGDALASEDGVVRAVTGAIPQGRVI